MSITAREAVESIFLMNHHVKDLSFLSSYLDFCDIAKQQDCKLKYADLKSRKADKLKELLMVADELDWVALEHYDVHLNAIRNFDLGKAKTNIENSKSVPSISEMLDWDVFEEEDEEDIPWIEEEPERIVKDDFWLPDEDVETLKMRILVDINEIYRLKDEFIKYALMERDSGLDVKILNRQMDDYGKKYVGIKINEFIFHYPSDEVYDLLDGMKEKNYRSGNGANGDGEMHLYKFAMQEVNDAIKSVEEFYHEKIRKG